MESSRRHLLNDMAEHRPISKNNPNTFHPRFGLTPKKRYSIPQNEGFVFAVRGLTGFSNVPEEVLREKSHGILRKKSENHKNWKKRSTGTKLRWFGKAMRKKSAFQLPKSIRRQHDHFKQTIFCHRCLDSDLDTTSQLLFWQKLRKWRRSTKK